MIIWADDDLSITLTPFLDELEESGYDVMEAENPDEMWSELDNNSENIRMIIMDILMPTGKRIDPSDARMGILTGLRVLEEIKKQEHLANIPILIFTIVAEQEVFDWAQDNGVKVLKKQAVLPKELVKILENMGIEKDRAVP